ncbi:hypothetical protein NE865_09302 [Phthorimaea operculella]|nr:hypothetical protein NE865_09302 [Phthorimaea operculella]
MYGASVTHFLFWSKAENPPELCEIDSLCAKLGGSCYALGRLSSTLPKDVVRTCYFATVQSLLQYGIELWGRAADWERVSRMQKRAIRAIARVADDDESVRPLFVSEGIMTLPSLLIFQTATYVWENRDEFTRKGDRHARQLRHANRLWPVTHKLTKTAKTIKVMGPAVYNRLPEDITSSPNLNIFKKRLRRWLIGQALL